MGILLNTIGLQDALCDEIAVILADTKIANTGGDARGFHVYPQFLPRTFDGQAPEDDPEMYPYAIVAYGESETRQVDDPWGVRMYVMLGIYDEDQSNQGHRILVPQMEKITNRFLTRPLLGDYWTARPEMSMQMQTSDFYPFFYGQVELVFDQYKMTREDPLHGRFQCQYEEANWG